MSPHPRPPQAKARAVTAPPAWAPSGHDPAHGLLRRWLWPKLHRLSAHLDGLADRVVLFRRGNWLFVSFGLFASLGTLVTLSSMGVILVGQGLAVRDFLGLAIVGSAAVVAASWIAAQLLDLRLLRQSPWQALRRPVFVSWGGILAMPAVLGVFSWTHGVSLLLLLDALIRALFLGHALGRLGCLSYGCCFGRPTRGPLAITYRNPDAKAVRVGGLENVRLHPAPLYEAILDLGLAVVVNAAAVLGAPLGVPTAVAFVVYGLGRFGVECLRHPQARATAGSWSLNHLLCLGLAVPGMLALRPLLGAGLATPAFAWDAALAAAPWILISALPGALTVLLGFSLHRERVGSW